MHTVRPRVRQEVLVQRRDRKLEQTILVQLWQSEGRDEQRVELERAVVALGREIVAQPGNLGRDIGNDLVLKPRFEGAASRKLIPGVNPVLDAPRRNVARVITNRHLRDPRLDQLLPNVTVLFVPRQRESVREIQTVIELVPLDTPLLVLWQRRGKPIGLSAELERDSGVSEDALAHIVGYTQIAISICDHTKHPTPSIVDSRLQARSLLRCDLHPHTPRVAAAKSEASSTAVLSPSNRSSTVSRPARPRFRASVRSELRR